MEKLLITNRKAAHEYEFIEKFTCGIVLLGHEVKSLKSGGGNLTGAYVSVVESELFLKGMEVPLYKKTVLENYESKRPRKLLLRKAEIQKIAGALKTKGVTLIPISCFLRNNLIKLEIAVSRGKKAYDKRESLKKKDQERQIQTAMKRFID